MMNEVRLKRVLQRCSLKKLLSILILIAFVPELVAAQGEVRSTELPNFHQVNVGLYRGAQPKGGGLKQLAARGIKTIINLRGTDKATRTEETEAHALGMNFYNVPMRGRSRPTDQQVERVLSLINAPENQPVFVHCQRGADRTGTIIACYRIAHDHWTSRQAKAEAKSYGMFFTQFGMKDYIRDFYERRKSPLKMGDKAMSCIDSLRRVFPPEVVGLI